MISQDVIFKPQLCLKSLLLGDFPKINVLLKIFRVFPAIEYLVINRYQGTDVILDTICRSLRSLQFLKCDRLMYQENEFEKTSCSTPCLMFLMKVPILEILNLQEPKNCMKTPNDYKASLFRPINFVRTLIIVNWDCRDKKSFDDRSRKE